MNYLCKKLKIEVYEKDLEPYDVYDADEAFMTGTPFCMLPVTSLNGLKIRDGNRGKIFNKILLNWNKSVGINIEDQIKNWDKKNNSLTTQLTPYKFK
jgi:branched-chain amino acid aminotransferase